MGPSTSALRSACSSVVCATRPRHCSSSKMSLTAVRSLRWLTRSPHSLPYGSPDPVAGLGERTLPGRYAETVASPSSQNRQGYAVASPPGPLTPTRGPVRTNEQDDGPAGIAARTTKGLSGATVSVSYTHL